MTRPTTTGKAQDLITFTRSTTGTALAKISYGEELVTNGDFSSDSDWGYTSSKWRWSSGRLERYNGSGNDAFYQSFNIVEGKTYKITYDVEYVSGTSTTNVFIDAGGGYITPASINGSGSAVGYFTAQATKSLQFQIYGIGTFRGFVDNVSVKEVLYDQPDGTLQLFNHPINKPRIEYDAEGNCLGLLVEEARTNVITYSNELLTAPWNGGAGNVVSNIPSIDGGQCFKLSSNGGAADYWIQSGVASNGQRKSIWARTVSGTGTAHILGHNSVAATLVTLTEEWQRFSLNVGVGEAGGANFYAVDFRGSNTLSEILVFGAQVETGAFPTSYIPTSGSTVTRSADRASLAVSEFGYNQDQGTVFINCLFTEQTKPNLRVIDGNSNLRRWMYVNNPDDNHSLKYYDGTNNVSLINSGISLNMKAAVAVTPTQVFGAANSSNVESGAHSGTLLDISQFNFFANLNGHIKSIQYYPLRLSNAQLQALTV